MTAEDDRIKYEPSLPAQALVLDDNSAEHVAQLFGWVDAPSSIEITRECLRLAAFLVGKNRKYGDAALSPMQVFSRSSVSEGIRVRMDDKVKRLVKGDNKNEDEDVIKDLVGYYVLLQIAEAREEATRLSSEQLFGDFNDDVLGAMLDEFMQRALAHVASGFDADKAPHVERVLKCLAKAANECVAHKVLFPLDDLAEGVGVLHAADVEDISIFATEIEAVYATKASSPEEVLARLSYWTFGAPRLDMKEANAQEPSHDAA